MQIRDKFEKNNQNCEILNCARKCHEIDKRNISLFIAIYSINQVKKKSIKVHES
jgi:hypothetical protein